MARPRRHVGIDIGAEDLPKVDMAHDRVPSRLDKSGRRRRDKRRSDDDAPGGPATLLQQPRQHEDEIQPHHQHRLRNVELRLEIVVKNRQRRDRVNELVQAVPARRAEAPDHRVGRGRAERGEAQPGGETDRQIETQDDLRRDVRKIELLVDDIEAEMREGVGEGRHADHPSHRDQLGPLREAAQRRHQQRKQHEPHRPIASAVDHLGDRLGIEHARRRLEHDPSGRREQEDEHDRLQDGEAPVALVPGGFQPGHGDDPIVRRRLCKPHDRYAPRRAFVSHGRGKNRPPAGSTMGHAACWRPKRR